MEPDLKNGHRRPVPGLELNDRDPKLSGQGLAKNDATWSNSVSLPKRDPLECTCLSCQRKKLRKAIEDAGHANMSIDDVLKEIAEQRGKDWGEGDCIDEIQDKAIESFDKEPGSNDAA